MAANQRSTTRSYIFSHSFPSFYACYLLKSSCTPLSRATYIGSTPRPPTRIRQHNGEIGSGASKTIAKRPWVMQMIVHGFPSKLAALQFEWAWQHHYKARHLRGRLAKTSLIKRVTHPKIKIQVVKIMLRTRPYNTWPLHVKLFTEEAVRFWNEPHPEFPEEALPGFTASVELEGVDGLSGEVGAGREGPIDVMDQKFTSAYLAKNTRLLASNHELSCSVCSKPVSTYATDPLTTALCPNGSCTAVSHLLCLSENFLGPDTSSLIPRGGKCKGCHEYVLWGDVIRGCYRRSCGAAVAVSDDDDDGVDEGNVDEAMTPIKVRGRPNASKTIRSKRGKGLVDDSSEGELFDLDVSSTDEGSQNTPSKPKKRPRLSPSKKPLNTTSAEGSRLVETPKRVRKTTKATAAATSVSQTVTAEAGSSRLSQTPKRVRKTIKATVAATTTSPTFTAEAGPSRPIETPKRVRKATKTSPATTKPSKASTAELELSRPLDTPKRVRRTTKTTVAATQPSHTMTAEAGPSRIFGTPKRVRKTTQTAVSATKPTKRKYHTDIDALVRQTSSLALDDSESGESFDFGGIELDSSDQDEP